MQAVWKYPLEIEDQQIVAMPRGTEAHTVQALKCGLVLYAIGDTQAAMVDRRVFLRATGQPINFEAQVRYVGTAKTETTVWHVFID